MIIGNELAYFKAAKWDVFGLFLHHFGEGYKKIVYFMKINQQLSFKWLMKWLCVWRTQ